MDTAILTEAHKSLQMLKKIFMPLYEAEKLIQGVIEAQSVITTVINNRDALIKELEDLKVERDRTRQITAEQLRAAKETRERILKSTEEDTQKIRDSIVEEVAAAEVHLTELKQQIKMTEDEMNDLKVYHTREETRHLQAIEEAQRVYDGIRDKIKAAVEAL